jgi:hypothetical protein
MYYSTIRLYCLQPIVLDIILMNLTQGRSLFSSVVQGVGL